MPSSLLLQTIPALHTLQIPASLELLGLAVACWFTYHYLLFKDGRERLALLLQELRERILGGIESQTRL